MVSLNDIRLDNVERNALLHALAGLDEEVYVFGSRLDRAKKGGDIDIVVYQNKTRSLSPGRIAQQFFIHCEEKIDVLVFDKDALSAEQRAFLSTLRLEKIR